MAPTKRVSVGGNDERALKKRMLDDSKTVANNLKRNKDLPEDAVATLREAAPFCLGTFADQRHEYQASIVGMIGQALGGVEVTLQSSVHEAEEKVKGMDKSLLEIAFLEQVRTLADARAAAAHKEADVGETRFKCRKAAEALAAASKLQMDNDLDYSAVAQKKEKLDMAKSNIETLKLSPPEKKVLSKLETTLKDVGVDSSLLPTLGNVLRKDIHDRGEFDLMTLKNLDDELTAKFNEVVGELASLEPGKAEREAAMVAAQGQHDAAVDAFNNAEQSLKLAKEAEGAIESALDIAEYNIRHFGKALKDAQDELAVVQRELGDFQVGPLATYNDLKSREAPSQSRPAGDTLPEEPEA